MTAARKAIPTTTRLRLFSEAAGHCQNRGCLVPLFPPEMGGNAHIAEMAHLIPHGNEGPRHEDRPDEAFDTYAFENLILLCPTCHTKIDKDPDAYPRNLLLGWKETHLANLALKQGIKAYEDRQQARAAILALSAENHAIWETYAPVDGSEFEYDPESATSKAWSQRMRSVILPNHYRLQAIIQANVALLETDERKTYAAYQEHVRGLAERHITGVPGRAIRYPAAMEGLFA